MDSDDSEYEDKRILKDTDNRKRKNLVIFSTVILIITIFLVLFLSFFVFVYLRNKERMEETDSLHEYRYLRFDPSSQDAQGGFSTVDYTLESGEFESYHPSESNWHTLISNFNDNQYVCTGTCYCDQTRRRRRRNSAASGIRIVTTVLVAAVSTIVASKLAGKYFEEECANILDDCPLDHVRSEKDVDGIEYCNKIAEGDDFDKQMLENYDSLPDEGNMKPTKENVLGNYACRGYCIPLVEPKKFVLNIDLPNYCSKLFLSAKYGLGNINPDQLSYFEEQGMKVSDVGAVMFAATALDEFCKKTSESHFQKYTKSDKYSELKKKHQVNLGKMMKNDICGGIIIGDGDHTMNPKTECKKVLSQN